MFIFGFVYGGIHCAMARLKRYILIILRLRLVSIGLRLIVRVLSWCAISEAKKLLAVAAIDFAILVFAFLLALADVNAAIFAVLVWFIVNPNVQGNVFAFGSGNDFLPWDFGDIDTDIY
jgi:hypothetical protein